MLKNWDRHLTKNEWGEMSLGAKWVPLEAMGFSMEENPTESKTVTIDVAQEETERPKPPAPRAPCEFRTYPEDPTQEPWKLEDPAPGSGNYLGGAGRTGKDCKEKDHKEKSESEGKVSKWRDPKGGEFPKEKTRGGNIAKEKEIQTTTRRWGGGDS